MIDAKSIFKVVSDRELSWKAKGIFVYMLSLETGERIDLGELRTKDAGRQSTRNGINELIVAGYLRRETMRTNTGYYYRVFDGKTGGNELNWFKTGTECVSPNKPGDIYVIHNPENGLTKIGFSTDVASRIKSLQYSFPGSIELAVFYGTRQDEHNLHERFIAQGKHEYGEWFRLTDRDILWIKDCVTEQIETPW